MQEQHTLSVSVVIPCYNVEAYIEECVQSVMKQTAPLREVICVDNNSSDGTWAVLESLAQKYPLLVIARELKPGANCARNKGLVLAQGEWIQFLDADDLLEPSKIAHQLALIDPASENVSYIGAAFKRQDIKGKITPVTALEQDHFLAPFINQSGITSSNLWRRHHLISVRGWNNDLRSSQEADLMQRLVLAGGTHCLDPDALTIIRERESGQITQSNPAPRWTLYITIRLEYMRQLKQLAPADYQRLEQIFYDFLMVSICTLAQYDKTGAIALYEEHIRPHWCSAGLYGWSRPKFWMIRLMGFSFYVSVFQLKK